MTGSRPTKPQPTVAARRVPKNPWHLDPDISWFGPGMYGARTGCGVTLTKTVLGVASRTLPCGTRVTFRNPANGRTVTVRVIDRGPYVAGRIWDMTGGLCTYLNHCYTGTMYWKLAG
jgi:rare lipoprotein A